MITFIDTSAIFALISEEDDQHAIAKKAWAALINEEEIIYCNNYILVEAATLLQRRIGMDAVRAFQTLVVPSLNIEWITESQHEEVISIFMSANRRRLSLVDWGSFMTMRRLGIDTAFTFDDHFKEQGFTVTP
jgi:predicted nucleic acid-binding protein